MIELHSECQALQCSHSCQLFNKVYHCVCNNGFYLASFDNRTCVSKGLVRFHGSLKLQNASYIPLKVESLKSKNAKKVLIENQLRAVIGDRVRNLKNLTVLDFKDGGIVEVHFFAFENDSVAARDIWTKSLNNSRFGTIGVSSTHLSFDQEPALSIQSLKVRDGEMIIAGNEVMLTCITYGSSKVEFTWLKDGVPINHNFTKNNWDAVLPKSVDDKRTAIFTVGIAEEAHAGTYTCRVTDFGEVQERKVNVRVIGLPKVTVTPRTLTIDKGNSVSITCLTNVIIDKLGFIWTKNNNILASSYDGEIVEDIFPSGSRLKISSADTSATYSCTVSGLTKSTQVDSRITVISSHVIPVCPQDNKCNILWAVAAANTFDIQNCPAGFEGEAVRHCTTLTGKPYWEEPDFSLCISKAMAEQQFKLENMKLGFMLTTPMDVLVNISNYLKSRDLMIYPGEGEPILNLLRGVMEYRATMSSLPSNHITNVFFDIISRLLINQRSINKEVQVLKLVRLVQETAISLGQKMVLNTTSSIDRKGLAADIVRRIGNSKQRLFAFSRRFIDKDWYTNPVTVLLGENISIQRNYTEEVVVINYHNLAKFLPKRSTTKFQAAGFDMDVEYELVSHMVTVAYLGDGIEKSLPGRGGYIQVSFSRSSREINRMGWNLSCGLSNLSAGRLTWSLDDCSVIVTDNATNCRCSSFGTYAVLLTLMVNTNGEIVTATLDTVVAIGCFVGSVMVLLTLICLMVCWRSAFRGFVVMKIHVCIGLLGAMITVLVASQFALPSYCFPYVTTLVEFFLLEPLTMHVCLELFLYLELANVHHIRNAIVKITLLGWGIPTLVTGATVVVQAQEGFNIDRWWMQVGDTYFFGFTISAVILFALYILLYLVVNLELRQSMSDGSPHRATVSKRMGLLRRSLIMQLAVTAFALMNVVRGNYTSSWYRYTFATVVGTTGFLTFLLYTVRSESPGCICSSKDSSHSVKSSAEMSIRSTTTSSLPKPEEATATTISIHNHDSSGRHANSVSRHGLQCQPGVIDFGETADLLKTTIPTVVDCNSAVSSERCDCTGETYLENCSSWEQDVVNDANDRVSMMYHGGHIQNIQIRPTSHPQLHKPKNVMGIVDYEGSPKKYPIGNEIVSGMYGWILGKPHNMPRPEPGTCYLGTSPVQSVASRASPESSSTSLDYYLAKSNVAQPNRNLSVHQTFPRSDYPLDITIFETLPPKNTNNRLPDVSCNIDGKIRGDQKDTVV
ncbi:hypothetical protein CHUAL_005581 [Chamberlinius hualienensis]